MSVMRQCGYCLQYHAMGSECPEQQPASSLAASKCSLPGLSVKKLLTKWERDIQDWKESEARWRRELETEDTVVRMNCCRVRARTLEKVIDDVRAEAAAASMRQPEEND